MPLRVAILGLGFMGRTHAAAYARAAASGLPVQVLGVADPKAREILGGQAASAGNIATQQVALDVGALRIYASADEALADPEVDAISVCTYTDTHAAVALAALAAGKHVLIEKPVALSAGEVARVRDAAAARPRQVAMPAMCMRFWPGWDWLKDRIADQSLGKLRSLTLTRLGAGPTWAAEFYRDVSRSGGALFDLHVHDTDFVCHCFGTPSRTLTTGCHSHLTTLYQYDGLPGVHIAAEGAWDIQPGAGFRMRFFAHFERASAEWDLAHAPTVTVFEGAASRTITPDSAHFATGYDAEVFHFVQACLALQAGTPFTLRATMDDAAAVARVLDQERAAIS
ncbi:MAG TPA: Gfo/Idh/MocA family oxidoreductase [Phycisphaerales bacterium]|nr:Gfo/Idh/MocA family oxidoreductase [Phycisphaerales bacterium]